MSANTFVWISRGTCLADATMRIHQCLGVPEIFRFKNRSWLFSQRSSLWIIHCCFSYFLCVYRTYFAIRSFRLSGRLISYNKTENYHAELKKVFQINKAALKAWHKFQARKLSFSQSSAWKCYDEASICSILFF